MAHAAPRHQDQREPVATLVAKVAITAAFLLTPLVVSPWTPEAWETAKGFVLVLLATVAAFSFVVWALRRPTGHFSVSVTDIALVLVIVASLLGLLTSAAVRTSLVGFSGYVNDSVAVTLSILTLVVVASRLRWQRVELAWLLAALVGGTTVVALTQLVQFSGVHLFALTAADSLQFTLAGNSLATTAMLCAAGVVVSFTSTMLVRNRFVRLASLLATVLLSAVTILIDDATALVALAIGLGVLTVFSLPQPKVRRLGVGGALALAFVLLLYLLPVGRWTGFAPSDVVLPTRESAAVATAAVRHSPVWGSGPATFYYDFARYRPESFNASPNWNVRFLKAGNQWWQWLATIGPLGVGALLAACIVVGRRFFRTLSSSREVSVLDPVLLGLMATTLAMSLLVPFTASLLVLWWGAFILLRARGGDESPLRSWRLRPELSAVPLVLTVGALLVSCFLVGRTVLADGFIERAQVAGDRSDRAAVQRSLERANFVDPGNPVPLYLRAVQALSQAQDAAGGNAPDTQAVVVNIRSALAFADQSITKDVNNPARYEAVLVIYEQLAALVVDADVGARTLYERLLALEPANPRNAFGMGQTLLVTAARLSASADTATDETAKADLTSQADDLITSAQEQLTRALALRPDYLDAAFRLALSKELAGDPVAARTEIATLVVKAPQSPALWYELGRLQRVTDQRDAAVTSFKQVVALFPNHSNAHFQLAELYAADRRIDDARREYELVLALNPGNAEVQKRLNELVAP